MESFRTDVWPLFLQGEMFVVQRIQHGLTSSSNQHLCGMGRIVKVAYDKAIAPRTRPIIWSSHTCWHWSRIQQNTWHYRFRIVWSAWVVLSRAGTNSDITVLRWRRHYISLSWFDEHVRPCWIRCTTNIWPCRNNGQTSVERDSIDLRLDTPWLAQFTWADAK